MNKRWAGLAAVAGGLCVQCAGAGSLTLPVEIGGAFSVPVTTMKEARYGAMIRQQYDFSCGSAALSTLLTYHYRFPVTEETVFEEMFAHGEQEKVKHEGFSLLDMKRYLEAHGYQADGFEAPLAKLASAAIPAIVLINDHGYNHFVVIKGIREGRVLIGDPSAGTRVMAQERFESIWVNQILFIISDHQDVAGFNLAADWHVATQAPLGTGIDRNGLGQVVMPKFGNSDF